ncbi:MAG: sulfurtransferase TusA family protein [Spirochaetia bacterium]|nr:sulfurtransferase TusA family protein [Spirochaetia bacterium]
MIGYILPDSIKEEVGEFKKKIMDYKSGLINPIQFKGIRVPHGIYEQRKENTYMMRIRCAGGIVTPKQLKKAAELAQKYGSDVLHITTRQEMQLHYVNIEDIIPIYDELISVGLSSRGGGGNTIRNIMASYDSGVSKEEVFDVSSYAVSLTSKMIAEKDSWGLPRKFKISFSNGGKDHCRAMITDLGFIAKVKDGQKGFKVYCAGGMGASTALGVVLFEFVPEDKVYCVTSALKIMFNNHGNRRQKNKSRIRFLLKNLGEEKFKNFFHEEYNTLIEKGCAKLPLEELTNEDNTYGELSVENVSSEEFEIWQKRYVKEQKQKGLFSIEVPLFLGDISSNDALLLAESLSRFGDNVIRFSIDQNIHIRNVPEKYLGNIFNLIKKIKTLSENPAVMGKMIACTGADTCKLGLCLPRGVTPEIQKTLLNSGINLENANVKIHISGCANSCGCHHSADLGFKGKIIRNNKELLPGYAIVAGASIKEESLQFAEEIAEIASKDLPFYIKDVFEIYEKEKLNSFETFINNGGKEVLKNLAQKYKNIPSYEENPDYYTDWTAKEKFSVLKGQKAECSASLYDMIDFDLDIVNKSIEKESLSDDNEVKNTELKKILFSTCRMLLVTKGIEASDENSVYDNFIKSFLDTSLIDNKFHNLVTLANDAKINNYLSQKESIIELAEAVKKLYESMDDSLQFKLEKTQPKETEEKPKEEAKNDDTSAEKFKDLRGVKCPMNFVKAKIELSTMKSGEKLAILLDNGEPIKNVPGSLMNEGHEILKEEKQGEHWFLVVKKA